MLAFCFFVYNNSGLTLSLSLSPIYLPSTRKKKQCTTHLEHSNDFPKSRTHFPVQPTSLQQALDQFSTQLPSYDRGLFLLLAQQQD